RRVFHSRTKPTQQPNLSRPTLQFQNSPKRNQKTQNPRFNYPNSFKKQELEQLTNDTKEKCIKVEKYLFEKLLKKHTKLLHSNNYPNFEKLAKLKEVLNEKFTPEELQIFLDEIFNLEKHLESESTVGDGGGGDGLCEPKARTITLPKVYRFLTIVQAGTAIAFSTFLVTHLSATTLATFGGIDLTNKTIILGRVYYQSKFLEPIVVFGALVGHVTAGIAKRSIKLYMKYKKRDDRKLTQDVHEKVEKIITDEKNEQGNVVRQKITTKTTTTISSSYLSRALSFLLPNHHVIGYILVPLVFGHTYINRILPRRHFDDSSLINATYVTLSLRKWPVTSYLSLTALIGLTAYHVTSGFPVVYKILRGSVSKKNGEKQFVLSDSAKKKLRNGIMITSIGLLTTGLLVIGGKFGKDPKIPLRTEYLKVYGQVLPQSWIR
ncbi:2897_t:CDS:2, partial [Funneliformis caledonium]